MRSAAHRASIIWLPRWGEMPNSAAALLYVAPAATRAAMVRLRASWLLSLLLRFFLMVARDLYKAMQARPPANEWGFDNRILLGVHNSFWVVFAGLEAVFLALCYAFYFIQNRAA